MLNLFPVFSQFCEAGIGYDESACGNSPTTSSSKILIKGGTVVNAHHQELADVYVEDGIIVSVKPHINVFFLFFFSFIFFLVNEGFVLTFH